MRLLVAPFAFIPTLASAAPLPDAVPIEVFAAPPAIEGPSLSPDGNRIAAKFLFAGKQSLVVTPLAAVRIWQGRCQPLAMGQRPVARGVTWRRGEIW